MGYSALGFGFGALGNTLAASSGITSQLGQSLFSAGMGYFGSGVTSEIMSGKWDNMSAIQSGVMAGLSTWGRYKSQAEIRNEMRNRGAIAGAFDRYEDLSRRSLSQGSSSSDGVVNASQEIRIEEDKGPINDLGGEKGLNLVSYYGFDPDESREGNATGGGVHFRISYTSPVIKSSARWAQRVYSSLKPSFWDNDNDGTIYYGGAQHTDGNTSVMEDNPRCPGSYGNVTWRAVSMLMQDHRPLVIVYWGYTTINGHTSSYPISVWH